MNNIILGFSENENNKIELLLRQLNYVAYSKHTSFNEILRIERDLYNPIIMTKEKLKDGYVYDFLNNTSNSCEHIIITNKKQQYDYLHKTLYVSNHIKKNQIRIALNMITKFNEIKLNNHIKSDDIDYEEAKNVLISNFDFTEDLAHKFIQKRCMNMCVKKSVINGVVVGSM